MSHTNAHLPSPARPLPKHRACSLNQLVASVFGERLENPRQAMVHRAGKLAADGKPMHPAGGLAPQPAPF